MMSRKQAAFEAAKLKRELNTHGADYTFNRPLLNTFGEPTEEVSEVNTFRCIFHLSSNYVTEVGTEGAKVCSKHTEMLLTTHENGLKLENGDVVVIKGKKYAVIDVNNIDSLDVYGDISLEVFQDGKLQRETGDNNGGAGAEEV